LRQGLGGYIAATSRFRQEVIVVVMRYDPFREVDRQIQQLANRMQESSATMAMDAYRRGDTVYVNFDLPGVDAGSIELTAEQNTLTVRAERRWTPDGDDQVLAQERPQGTFTRQLMLGEHLDTEHIEAAYEDGVLTLEVPVAPAAKPRKIEIRGSGQRREAIDVEASAGRSAGNGESS
jgi:HSP20 family protein